MTEVWPKEPVEPAATGKQWTCSTWEGMEAESHEFMLRGFSLTIEPGNALGIDFELVDALDEERWEVSFPKVTNLFLDTTFSEPSSFDDAYEIGTTEVAGDVFTIGIGDGSVQFVATDGGWIQRIA